MHRISVALAAIVLFTATAAEPARPEELDLLNRYAGTWEMTEELTTPGEPVIKRQTIVVVEWILNRRFLRYSLRTPEDARVEEAQQLVGYDPIEKSYRWWVFDRDNRTFDARGQYNQQTKRWEWVAVMPNKFKLTNTDGFIDDDTFEFDTKFLDPNGVEVFRAQGTGKRKK